MVRSKICSSNLRRSAALLPNFSSSADNWHCASSLTLPLLLAFSTSSRATARLLVTDDLWPLRTCRVFLSFKLSSSVSTIESVTDEPLRQRRAPSTSHEVIQCSLFARSDPIHTRWSKQNWRNFTPSDPIHTKWSNSHEVIQAKLKKFHTKWSNSHEVIQAKLKRFHTKWSNSHEVIQSK